MSVPNVRLDSMFELKGEVYAVGRQRPTNRYNISVFGRSRRLWEKGFTTNGNVVMVLLKVFKMLCFVWNYWEIYSRIWLCLCYSIANPYLRGRYPLILRNIWWYLWMVSRVLIVIWFVIFLIYQCYIGGNVV